MHIDKIDNFEGFLELKTAWDELCQRSERPSFFLSHRWFQCCWPGQAAGVRPLVLVVRDGTQIVGVAPLVRQRANWRMFPTRAVSLMQNQDSPFADVVLARGSADGVLAAILEHVAAMPGWHVLSLPKIGQSSPTHRSLTDALVGRSFLCTAAARSPVLVIEDEWKAFWEAQSQRFKKTVRNIVNRVERLGKITVEEMGSGSAPGCLEVFDKVAARSWKADLPMSVTRNREVARFFQALTDTLVSIGHLSLWVLRLDGVPIATEYHVRDGDTVYALRSDFDDRYREASPGAYLNYQIVRAYFERKIRIYDMGPGDSDYKQRWSTAVRDLDTFWIFNRTPYATALYDVERWAVPRLRRARAWFPNVRARSRSGKGEHA